jgi:hypothetical protein
MSENRIPAPIDQGKHSESTLMYLDFHWKEHLRIRREEGVSLTVEAERYACGFPLPNFQRDHVWTLDQEVAFIESAWLGLPLGTYTLHQMDWGADGMPRPFSGWIIDGQQRLTSIQRYWEDAFPVFGLRWSELTRLEQRRFMSIKFAHYEADISDEAEVRDLYNRLALGGTPHHAHQRASIKA